MSDPNLEKKKIKKKEKNRGSEIWKAVTETKSQRKVMKKTESHMRAMERNSGWVEKVEAAKMNKTFLLLFLSNSKVEKVREGERERKERDEYETRMI